MSEKILSFDRVGLRWKVIFVMVGALVVIMATVGTIFFVRVSDELQTSLEIRGRELTRSLRSESMLDLAIDGTDLQHIFSRGGSRGNKRTCRGTCQLECLKLFVSRATCSSN